MPASLSMDGRSGEAGLSDEAFRRLSAIVRDECGIVLSQSKRTLVVSRLGRRLRELSLPDFEAYCRLLEGDGGRAERRTMTSLLSTNVTRFFREAHHFATLETDVLPPLVARARKGGRVRIWSAGCSSGQEPYSIGMCLLGLLPDAHRFDIRVLATDLDPVMVRMGQEGRYRSVGSGEIPAARRTAHFTASPDTGDLCVTRDMRALVTFAELNLMHDWPMREPFDVIFCRNVVIYFDMATQQRLWARFAEALMPGGHLFIGHSERVSGPAEPMFAPAGVTQYVRR